MQESQIDCRENGPLVISGEFVIQDAQGKLFGLAGRKRISLCRCGASENKPFCDGGHNRIGYRSSVEARSLPPRSAAPASTGGATEIKCRDDGPLRVVGNVALRDSQGREFDLGGRTNFVLCRCGHTQDAPFCDGSHRAAGFRSTVAARELPPPKKL